MAVPTTRAEFKAYCLRSLGAPVLEINVDDDQVEDRIDESLRYYWDYHFDGSDKTYYKHQVTEQNKLDKYITLPENIIGAVLLGILPRTVPRVVRVSHATSVSQIFILAGVVRYG